MFIDDDFARIWRGLSLIVIASQLLHHCIHVVSLEIFGIALLSTSSIRSLSFGRITAEDSIRTLCVTQG